MKPADHLDIVIKGVLSPDEVAELNDLADRKFETYPYGGAEQGREMSLIPWGDPVKKLIDHPRVLPYLVELLGPRLRLDHDYGMFMRPGDRHGGLHGGHGGSHWYRFRNGAMENGLTVVTYFLSDNPAGVGGFACVPGSHKRSGKIDEYVADRVADHPDQCHLEAPAGSVAVFNGSVWHSSYHNRSGRRRRTLQSRLSRPPTV